MTDYLVDTDWMVDFLKGRRNAPDVLASLPERSAAISIITFAELYEGLLEPAGSSPAESFEFLETIDVLGVDMPIARTFAQLRADLRQKGKLIPDLDLFIAATALRHNMTLLTRDKHFDRIPGLKLWRK